MSSEGMIPQQNAEALIERFRVLLELSRKLTTSLDLEETLEGIVGAAGHLLGAPVAGIRMREEGTEEFRVRALFSTLEGITESAAQMELKVGEGLTGWVFLNRKSVIVDDVRKDARWKAAPFLEESGLVSYCGCPLVAEGEALGVLFCLAEEGRRFTPEELSFLEALSTQAVIALQNARLFEATQEQVSRLTALGRAAERVTSELELEAALKAVMEEGSRVLGADRCAFFVQDEKTGQLEPLLNQGLSEHYLADVLAKREVLHSPKVLASGKPAAFEDALTAPELRHVWESNEREGICSMAFLPLRYRERPIGVLVFYHNIPRPYTAADLEVAMTFAHQAAIAVENAKLFTERKRAEEELHRLNKELERRVEERTRELKEAQEELVRKERLAVLGQLASGVSHELRQPLGVLRNSAYFLNMKREGLDEKSREHVDIVGREVERANRIIGALLDFARVKTPVRQPVDINKLVREALEQAVVPDNVAVRLELDEALPPVPADQEHLGRVLLNLILNAIQAMPGGGEFCIKGRAQEGRVEVAIEDTGCGIQADALPKVFEPLFTTKARGIGLGLAIVKNIIEAHGGRIAVESQEGRGSTFTIALPLKPAP